MHLYDARLGTFIPEATSGQIADILKRRFKDRFEHNPGEDEYNSWNNSLGAFAESVANRRMDNAWLILEYQLPLASLRIDAMVVGTDQKKKPHAVLAEFKQWERGDATDVPEVVRIGGVDMLHPSAQVRNYRQYLEDAHSAFVEGDIFLASCAFLHNAKTRTSGFFDPRYKAILEDSPMYSAADVDAFADYIHSQTGGGARTDTVESILHGAYRPSKKLLDHVASSISGHAPWKLLDNQQLIYNEVMAEIDEAKRTGTKRVIIVTGGPGTGKSVIAVQIMGEAAKKGYNVVHATGSKAFTTNLRGIVGRREPFVYFNQFTKTLPNSIDLIISDEAHRLRESSADRFRKGTGRPQVGEIVDTARVSLFLLDDQQSVRANEVGSVSLITDYADSKKIPVSPYNLGIQFRTGGSDSYINWIEHVLGSNPNRSLAWKTNQEYEVKLFERVEDMENALKGKIAQDYTARMVAGFCWPWSDPHGDNSLAPDVQIGAWKRPWNRKPGDMYNKPAEPPARHPYKIWATEPKGFGEIGCIYSAQGFEFDYVGVIFGNDLRWNTETNSWTVDMQNSRDQGFKNGLSRDAGLALQKLKHIYRVLSTRGMKGTYFYFLDPETRKHFEKLGAE